jgi:hypothetical protein
LIPVWHGSAQFSNWGRGAGTRRSLGGYGYGPIFAHQEEDERVEYYVLRDRNIVGSMRGKPRLWRWLLLFQSGNLPAPGGDRWSGVSTENA